MNKNVVPSCNFFPRFSGPPLLSLVGQHYFLYVWCDMLIAMHCRNSCNIWQDALFSLYKKTLSAQKHWLLSSWEENEHRTHQLNHTKSRHLSWSFILNLSTSAMQFLYAWSWYPSWMNPGLVFWSWIWNLFFLIEQSEKQPISNFHTPSIAIP